MRASGVVVVHPLIKSLLGNLQTGESCPVTEEFGPHTAMKPLNLARGGRRSGLSQQMLDPVFAADPIKEHLDDRVVEPAGEHLAVIGQDLFGGPISDQRATQPVAHRTSALAGHQSRTDTHPRVIINSRQCFSASAISKRESAHDVHLPQLHRRPAFPPFPLARTPIPQRRVDHRGPHQRPNRPPIPRAPALSRVWPARTPAAAAPNTAATGATPTRRPPPQPTFD